MTMRVLRVTLFFVLSSVMGFMLYSSMPEKLAQKKTVVVYGKNSCPWCVKAKSALAAQSVEYTFKDLSNDPSLMSEAFGHLEEGASKTIPQIFIGGEPIGGFVDLQNLIESNQLKSKIS